MSCKNFVVKHRGTDCVSYVYDIRYVGETLPTPFFLVWIKDEFKLLPASEFVIGQITPSGKIKKSLNG